MVPITHVTPFARSDGGMQGMVRRHRRRDVAIGFSPQVAAIFESAEPGGVDIGLGAAWWWTPHRLRQASRKLIHPITRGSVVVYHNGWALPLLAPDDRAHRRLAYLHSDWPGLAGAVGAMAPWCDGIICCSPELETVVRVAAPEFPTGRIHALQYPVDIPDGLQLPPVDESRIPGPIRIGIVGRVQYAQKRLDRLPGLLAAVQALGLVCEWHVIGDGRDRRRLASAVSGLCPVTFHGWLHGADYWQQLARLDYILFLTDFEGLPIALLEAMHCGAVPLYPHIGGQGERYAAAVTAGGVYASGDVAAAAAQLLALVHEPHQDLSRRSRELVARHTAENYEADFARVLRQIGELPPIAATTTHRRPRWSDGLPLVAIGRFYPDAIWR